MPHLRVETAVSMERFDEGHYGGQARPRVGEAAGRGWDDEGGIFAQKACVPSIVLITSLLFVFWIFNEDVSIQRSISSLRACPMTQWPHPLRGDVQAY